jgi:hypothetical protein
MNDEEDATPPQPDTGIPVAPPAHGAGGAPTPPPWSYRASGTPVMPAGARGRALAEPAPGAPQRPEGAPALPGPQRAAVQSFGPAGRGRSPLAVALLSVLTLGLYALIWHDRINAEMSDFDTRMRVRAATSTIAVVIPWLLGMLVTLGGAARIVLDLLKVRLSFDPHISVTHAYYLLAGLGVVPYLIVLIPFSLIAVVMTLERIRMVEDRVGITADAQVQPTHQVWLLIVPVIGGLAMIAAMQRRLNRAWELAAPRPAGLSA